MIGYVINDLGINNHLISNNQVWNILPDNHILIQDVITRLLPKNDPTQSKLHNESIFIRFFKQAMPQPI